MADDLGIDVGVMNPIAYAHMQLRGGWKNMAITSGIYALAIGLLMFATVRMDPRRVSTTLSAWHSGLLALQLAFLTLLASTAINGAIRVDSTSHMMESHRLMPISPFSAILGYLFGAPCQFLAMAAITFIIGGVATIGAGLPAMRWLVANAVLGGFALLLWSGILFFALSVKHGVRWYFGFIVAACFTQGMVLFLLPGLTLLTSPMINKTIFQATTSNSQLNGDYVLAMAAQAAVIAIFLTSAARRFRRPDRPAMGVPLSLLLLAAWVGISAVALVRWEEICPLFSWRDETTVQFISTLVASALVALVPTASASRADLERQQQGDGKALPALLTLIVPLLCASIIVALTFLPLGRPDLPLLQARLRTWLSIGLFLLATGFLHRMLSQAKLRAGLLTGLFVVLAWVGPFLAEMVRFALSDKDNEFFFGMIFTASPLGLLIAIWSPEHRHPINTNPGLLFQAGLALLLALLFYRPLLGGRQAPATGDY